MSGGMLFVHSLLELRTLPNELLVEWFQYQFEVNSRKPTFLCGIAKQSVFSVVERRCVCVRVWVG